MISKERIETNQLLLELTDIDLTVKSLKDDISAQKYYNVISNHIDNQLQSAIDWIDSNEAKEFFFNDAYYQGEIWDSLEEDWDNILSGQYETIDDLLEEVYDYGKLRGYSNMAETLRYTPTDRLAFAFARNYNYGLIRNLDNDLRGAIKERMTRAAIQGENPYSLAPDIYKLGVTQLPGSTFTPYQRAVLIARTETSRIQNTGILQSYVNEGYTQVKLLTAEDDHVCTVCLRYAYEFNSGVKVTFENRGPELVHDIKSLIKGGSYPPFHPMCYMPDTQVFTNHGWKYFYDLTDNDKILSLNPETNETEFLKPNKIIAHENTHGYMYHIHNKWFDTCVTPDHDCFINQRREVKGKKIHVPEFRKPDELNSESYFLRTVENNNISSDKININGLKFDASDYAFFIAWYLSEGSVLHNPDTAKARSYPIKITQMINENREIIEPIFKKIADYLGIKLYIGKEYFEFHSKELHDYLVLLGRSHEKYVPDEVFTLSKDDLNIFLDNYVRGDGHSRISDNELVQNSVEKTIITSSVNLVNGLSYITLLAGYYPSISLASEAGNVQEHHNGVYTQNHDAYCLRINRSKYTQFANCTVDKVPYDGMVYCVELPKYHTLWTKRNGKTSWNGNCRCTYLSVWESKGAVPDEPYTVNLTPIDNWEDAFTPTLAPPLPPMPDKRRLDWDDIATPQDVADYFGYEYSFEAQPQVPEGYRIMEGSDGRRYNVGRNQNTGKFHKFYDRENDCSIYVHQSLGKLDKKTNKLLIDTANGGNGLYDLKTVIKMYNDAPTILKENNTTITFSNRKAKRLYGYNKLLPGNWLKVLDNDELSKHVTSGRPPVWIDIFKNGIEPAEGHSLQRILYHEMAHGWDMNPSRDPKGTGAISNERSSGGYGELCYQQHNFNEDTRRMEVSDKNIVDGLSSEYGVRHHDKTSSFSEDFADAVSMVAFKNIPDKNNATILKPNYKYDNEPYNYSEWISKYPHKVERLERWMGLR